MEQLTTDGKEINWESNEVFLSRVRELRLLDSNKVTKIFGKHNSIEYQALCRVQGGHYNIETLTSENAV